MVDWKQSVCLASHVIESNAYKDISSVVHRNRVSTIWSVVTARHVAHFIEIKEGIGGDRSLCRLCRGLRYYLVAKGIVGHEGGWSAT